MVTDQACANTAPVSYDCGWCGAPLVRERGGYWWHCPESGHPSSHDPRRRGPRAWRHALRARRRTARCDCCKRRRLPERIKVIKPWLFPGEVVYLCDQCGEPS